MKALVTGATGLLGSNIVRTLKTRGIDVRILVRKNSSMVSLEGVATENFSGDVTDPESVINASRGCDVIIHAAANTSQWPADFKYYIPVNVTGTQNVVQAARINRIQRLIYVSTYNAFGYGTRRNPGTELSEFNMFRFNSGYVNSKFIAQQYVLSEAEKHGLPVVVVNPSLMLGPYDAKPSSGKLILMCLNKKVWFCPAGGKNFIDVRDAATAICNAIYSGIPGECYLLTNENLTLTEFYRKVNKVAGTSQFLLNLPKSVTRLIGLGGSLYSKISGMPVGLNITNTRLMAVQNYFSGKKAIEELDMPQTPLEISIADALKWFCAHQMVHLKTRYEREHLINRHFLSADNFPFHPQGIGI